jgi:hypothetical protein
MPEVTDYTALISNNSWNGLGQSGTPAIVTYSFPTAAPEYVSDPLVGFTAQAAASYQGFTAAEQTAARNALAQWAAVSGIEFVEVTAGEGEITFNKVNLAYSPNPMSGGFTVMPSRSFNPNASIVSLCQPEYRQRNRR